MRRPSIAARPYYATPGQRLPRRCGGSTRDRGRRAIARTWTPALYDGFVGDGDERPFTRVRATAPDMLGDREFGFADARLPSCCFATAPATGPTR